MYLLVDIDKCTGCRTCELACSFRWSGNFQPTVSAISLVKYEHKSLNVPVVCQQCSKPICVDVCPSGAMKRDKNTSVVIIDENKCRGCKMCITSCPFGAITFDRELSIARKCDLCISQHNPPCPPFSKGGSKGGIKGGLWETECIKFCPYNALEIVEEEKLSQKLKRKKIQKYQQYILTAK